MVVALEKTQEVGYLTSKKGSYNVGEVERIKKWIKLMVKNNTFLNSCLGKEVVGKLWKVVTNNQGRENP